MIRVNGQAAPRDGATIVDLLTELGVDELARGVAVAVNGEVVPRAEWPRYRLADGDQVEALTAMQGG